MIEDIAHKLIENCGKSVFTEMFTNTRKQSVFFARLIITKALRDLGWGVCKIGDYLNKDHATISYYIKKFEAEYKYNVKFKELADKILK